MEPQILIPAAAAACLLTWLLTRYSLKATITSLQARLDAAERTAAAQQADHKKREDALRQEYAGLRSRLDLAIQENSSLQANYTATAERLKEQERFVAQAQQSLKDAFGALSADALRKNNDSFVELAKAKLEEKVTEAKGALEKKEQAIGELVKPLNESLKNMDSKILALEEKRIRAYSDIANYLDQVKLTTESLKKETTNLVSSLKTSYTRGRYGELALRRLVEHAGMLEHCNFEEQVTVGDDNGKLRPDMVIKLPGGKLLVLDSKAPLAAYMKMYETTDSNEQRTYLTQHVAAVRDHLKKLSDKAYWNQFENTPDFVIMYIHIESSYSLALQSYPELIEEAMTSRIIIATPTILLSILSSIAYSWNQLKTMENIQDIRDAAVELYERSATLMEHVGSLGKALNSTVSHYNKTVGSLEGNFLPQARRIHQYSQAYTTKKLTEIAPIETAVRPLTAIGNIDEPAEQKS